MPSIFFYQTEIGKIGIAESGGALTNLYFPGEPVPADMAVHETDILQEAGRQLRSYFAGRRQDFTLPLAPRGTDFRRRVWASLCAIPYGKTRSYRQIAQSVCNAKAARAVGMANNKNPLPIFIPCHRVTGADGKPVGYGGGLQSKSYLLALENRHAHL